jgi:hypothetical protein
MLVLAAAGSIAAGVLGIACSSQPEPPAMPPFPGTEAFLDEQAGSTEPWRPTRHSGNATTWATRRR